jgi:hypothetical protein
MKPQRGDVNLHVQDVGDIEETNKDEELMLKEKKRCGKHGSRSRR